MKTIFFRALTFAVILGFAVLFSACAFNPAQGGSETEQAVVQTVCRNPVEIGVAVDQSGSMRWSGTPAVTAEDLKPLLEQVLNCGGTLGVTFIRFDSAKPVERFRVPEPPPMPAQPAQNKDEEDYEFADRLDEYRRQVKEREKAIRQKRADLQPKVESYLNNLAALLARSPKGATAFWSAISRLKIFLTESTAAWRDRPHRYLIIVSDAADTTGKTINAFKSDATILWVNANAPDKNLKDFPSKRFENFSAAVAEILATEGVK